MKEPPEEIHFTSQCVQPMNTEHISFSFAVLYILCVHLSAWDMYRKCQITCTAKSKKVSDMKTVKWAERCRAERKHKWQGVRKGRRRKFSSAQCSDKNRQRATERVIESVTLNTKGRDTPRKPADKSRMMSMTTQRQGLWYSPTSSVIPNTISQETASAHLRFLRPT